MKVGKLTSINYDYFKAQVSPSVKSNSVNLEGVVYFFGNIGSYLKVLNNIGEQVICEITSVFDRDQNQDVDRTHAFGIKELLLKPVGTISKIGNFSLGVGVFPSIYSDIEIVTHFDMEVILKANRKDEKTGIHSAFYLGKSKSLIDYPINLNITDFFSIHTAILGNSGSGKSNTISHVLQEIMKKEKNAARGARVLVFDVNGEYKNSLPLKHATHQVEKMHYKPLGGSDFDIGEIPFYLPHYLISLDEWCSFLLATDATQRPFLDKVLQECYRFYRINESLEMGRRVSNYIKGKVCRILNAINGQAESDTVRITAAASVISQLKSIMMANGNIGARCAEFGLVDALDGLIRSCNLNFGQNNQALEGKIQEVIQDVDFEQYAEVLSERLVEGQYYDHNFLRVAAELVLLEEDATGNRRIREYTSTMMARLDFFLENPECVFMRHSENQSKKDFIESLWEKDGTDIQIVNIDVSELSPDSLEVLTSVLTRVLFSERKNKRGEDRRKKPVHMILDEAHRYISKNGRYYLKENIFEKVAREGRKFSFYLIISSQRPSELSETVLSQCGNFIIHRIQNEVDMKYIHSVLPFFSDDFVNKIKQSVPGEALVFGNCVPMPLHVAIQPAKPEPDSANSEIAYEWFVSDSPKN